MLIDNTPKSLFSSEKAEQLVKTMQKDDPEWTYTPVHCPDGIGHSYIMITDEDGEIIGHL